MNESSGAPESPAGVSAMGLYQPAPEERHGGDRNSDEDQQSLTASGWSQVSFSEPQGKSVKCALACLCYLSLWMIFNAPSFFMWLPSTWSHFFWTRVALWSTIIHFPAQVRPTLHIQQHHSLMVASTGDNGFSLLNITPYNQIHMYCHIIAMKSPGVANNINDAQ